MAKIIITTHGDLANCLYESVGLFLANREGVEALGLGVDMDGFRKELENMIFPNKETEFLVLADLFGGTPFNIAASIIHQAVQKGKNIEIITGVNLPMLLEIVPMIDEKISCRALKEIALETGKEGIRDLWSELTEV